MGWIGMLIGHVLGRKKDSKDSFQMGSDDEEEMRRRGFGDTKAATIGESVQPGMRRTFDNGQNQYVNQGPSDGSVQPGQTRYYNEGTGQYQDQGQMQQQQPQQQQGGGFQGAMGNVQTIASAIGALQGNKKDPYQMRTRRRY